MTYESSHLFAIALKSLTLIVVSIWVSCCQVFSIDFSVEIDPIEYSWVSYIYGIIKNTNLVGLDNAGKTTILYKLKLGEIVSTIPTIGNFDVSFQ
jgi:hypothetical protein